jgi:hypothetical protein
MLRDVHLHNVNMRHGGFPPVGLWMTRRLGETRRNDDRVRSSRSSAGEALMRKLIFGAVVLASLELAGCSQDGQFSTQIVVPQAAPQDKNGGDGGGGGGSGM